MEEQTRQSRWDRLHQAMHAAGLQALVITGEANVYYLTGVWLHAGERVSALVIRPDSKALWIVHEMFASEASASGLPLQLWKDGESGHRAIAQALAGVNTYAVDGAWPASHLLALLAEMPGGQLPVLADTVMGQLRRRKDEAELHRLEKASQLADEVVGNIRRHLQPGLTEAVVAERLAGLWKEAGSPEMSFPPIIAAGTGGASPHHEPDDSVIPENTTVIVDTGGFYDRYVSDITRTFILGKPTEEMETVYRLVLAAQEAGIRKAKPGVTLGAVDDAVRKVIVDGGYGEYFTHRTGHGVGVDIHEEPFVVSGNDMVLEPGMVMSIEPGIYLPGKFGVRIEDLVVIEAAGARSLNKAPKAFEDILL